MLMNVTFFDCPAAGVGHGQQRRPDAASRACVPTGDRRSVALFSGRDAEETTVEEREAVSLLAEAYGVTIDGEYVDVRGVDGAIAHPAMDLLLRDAGRGGIGHVFTPDRSGLGRDAVDALWAFARLSDLGVRVHVGSVGEVLPRDLELPGSK